eukprot:820657-Pleurochrysis_carterae.AAC.4
MKIGLAAVLGLHRVLVVAVHLPDGLGINVVNQERAVVVQWMRLARIVSHVVVGLGVVSKFHAGRPGVGAVARVAIEQSAIRETSHPCARRQGLRLFAGSSAREVRITVHSVAVRSECVFETKGSRLLDTSQSKDRVGIVVRCLCCHGLTFRSAVCILGVVDVHCLAPGFVIAKVKIRPNVHEWNQLVALVNNRVVCVAGVSEWFRDRNIVAWLAVYRLIVPEAAGAFVRA